MRRDGPRLSVTPTTVPKEQDICINLHGLELGCQVLSVTPKAKAVKEMMANWTLSQISATAVATREVPRHQTE